MKKVFLTLALAIFLTPIFSSAQNPVSLHLAKYEKVFSQFPSILAPADFYSRIESLKNGETQQAKIVFNDMKYYLLAVRYNENVWVCEVDFSEDKFKISVRKGSQVIAIQEFLPNGKRLSGKMPGSVNELAEKSLDQLLKEIFKLKMG